MSWAYRSFVVEFKDSRPPVRVQYFTDSDGKALQEVKKDYGKEARRLELGEVEKV